MSDRHSQITELLALRDGEPTDLERLVGMPEEEREATIGRLQDIRHTLTDLPDVPIDDSAWLNLEPQPFRSAWLRFPLATAASIFFASAIGFYLIAGQMPGDPRVQPEFRTTQVAIHGDMSGLQLASLMRHSRDLERRLTSTNNLWRVADGRSGENSVNPIEGSLLLRLADVDGQIAALYERLAGTESADSEDDAIAKADLWRKRVGLLQSMVAIRSPDVPEIFEDSRSM